MYIRSIRKADNEQVAEIIRKVMTEYGAVGEGFSINDAEVDQMFESYQGDHSAFFVVADDENVYGCAGVGPLKGADDKICELKKMYLLPEIRGKGLGKQILDTCLQKAGELGYAECYLETLSTMHEANSLYRKSGFMPLKAPMGNTGHHRCETWYVKDLGKGKNDD